GLLPRVAGTAELRHLAVVALFVRVDVLCEERVEAVQQVGGLGRVLPKHERLHRVGSCIQPAWATHRGHERDAVTRRHQPVISVDSSPATPRPSAASASPAIRPPPISDELLMSGGRPSSRACSASRVSVSSALENTPPAPNHSAVCRLTKPPKDSA